MIRKDGTPDNAASDGTKGEWNGHTVLYRSNRVIVKMKILDGDSAQSTSDRIESISRAIPGGRMLRPPSRTGRVVFSVSEGEDIVEIARYLTEREEIEYAEPDLIDTIQLIPSDTRYPDQWAHITINSELAWDLETGGSSTLIGIIDSGISMSAEGSLDHPDLSEDSRYILGTDFVDGGTPRDMNSHGTHVVGIAAAVSNNATGVVGMNWNSNVYICRTLDAEGLGNVSDFASAVEEITDFAVDNNLRVVINYSGGGGDNQTRLDACQYASDRGMLICAATGNDDGGPVIFPAAYSTIIDAVIGVGATTSTDTVSSFSNVGPEVTVVAPGSGILSTTPTYSVDPTVALSYDTFDGTSMATPFVTGLVALMWSKHPSSTHVRIKGLLRGTAKKLGSGSFDNAWGYGRIDAAAALSRVEVPYVVNSPTRLAEDMVRDAGLDPEFSGPVGPGTYVISQSPQRGHFVSPGSTVKMRTRKGPTP